MRIPEYLKVSGLVYKVVQDHKFPTKDDLMGEICHAILEIRLSGFNQRYEQKYAREKIEEAFVHEIVHAVDCIYNNQSLEENEVERLAQGLYQVLKDNDLGGQYEKESN